MITNHEFVEKELTPEMGLVKTFNFRQEVLLSCSYCQIFYLDICKRDTGKTS